MKVLGDVIGEGYETSFVLDLDEDMKGVYREKDTLHIGDLCLTLPEPVARAIKQKL